MKNRVLITLSVLFLFACTSPRELRKEVYYTGFDFTKFSKQGFLFTPESYNSEYESIGVINTTLFPEVKNQDYRTFGSNEYLPLGETGWSYKQINVSEAIDSMFVQATRMGANAIVRFDVKNTSKQNSYITIPGIEVTGFAIKRKATTN
ncbi:MAG: hypothetical protein WCZ90_18830 [Melioribacteraceae bacterium]